MHTDYDAVKLRCDLHPLAARFRPRPPGRGARLSRLAEGAVPG